MERRYRVADHTFCLKMADSSPLWQELSNYAPFECKREAEDIFCLKLADSLPAQEKKLLYAGDDEDPGMARIAIYSIAEGLYIEMAPTQKAPVAATLQICSACRKGLLATTDAQQAKFAIDNSLMLMYAFRTAGSGTLEMHASAVTYDGSALLFLGRSGAGKSTHSRLWLENIAGSALLNDDNPIVRVLPGGEVRAYGSPWSGKTPCYKNQSAPVAAVVSIRQAPHNAIRRLSLPEAYAIIYPSCSGFRADRQMSDALHESIATFASAVAAFELECLPNADAAYTCKNAVSNER